MLSLAAPPLAREETEALTEQERLVLFDLITTRALSELVARDALRIHAQARASLRDVLCGRGLVHRRAYARSLATVTGCEYGSDLIEEGRLPIDRALIARFNPAELVNALVCPVSLENDVITVIAADPSSPDIERIVHQVVPDAAIVALVGTEYDITHLVDEVFQSDILHRSVHELRESRPDLSASRVATRPQLLLGGLLLLAILVSLALSPLYTLIGAITVISVFYTVFVTYRLVISAAGIGAAGHIPISTADVDDLQDDDLPIYSILVPVYREPKVVGTLIKALSVLDYPTEKLDVLLLMEADDRETIQAAKAAHPPGFFRFIYVPPAEPRTKPKACNYGLTFCRGDFVTIYDAEDIPEPDQLKKAILSFRQGPNNLVCMQAALNYFNRDENLLTRMFTLEYSYWFDYMLPGLDRLGLPIPLGGTSNHFRVDRLRELGAWDPFNVTEDADLGIRASVRGFSVGVIRSTTYEEANKSPRNWIRQRSRWIKGYMQTWLVHNRRPSTLLQQVGFKAWISYQLFIGGTCAVFLLHPWMWLLSLWNWLPFGPLVLDDTLGTWAHSWLLYNLIVGNTAGIILNILAVTRRRLFRLAPYALINPFYWWMHSIAAYMALWQLFTKPFYWEKTEHALTEVESDRVIERTLARTSAQPLAPGVISLPGPSVPMSAAAKHWHRTLQPPTPESQLLAPVAPDGDERRAMPAAHRGDRARPARPGDWARPARQGDWARPARRAA